MAETRFNLLEIDLTTGQHQVRDVTEDTRRFLGGRGLGAKLLWDRVPPGADPLSRENILYFGVGPATGLFGSIVNVSAKSPLTLLRGESNMNGHLGAELVRAGYNAGILITGKASNPVWIFVKDDQVEIRDASHLWGKLNLETQQVLRSELRKTLDLDGQNFQIASIGPAGEKMVRNANICHDFYHFAARLGMGAVMGSKNLKAIAVRGTRPPNHNDPDKIFEMIKQLSNDACLSKVRDRRWSHMVSMPSRYYAGIEGIKNHQLGWDNICELSNPLLFEQRFKLWNDSCTLCHIGCKIPYMRRDPPLGPCAGELRHDNTGGWNANVMLPGFYVQTYLTPFTDDLGLDGEDISGVIAWCMECYERGLITKKDLGGIDLTWGNLKAICQLLEKIARRVGVGDMLAEGLKFAPQILGRGSEKYAMHSKGVAITSFDVRESVNSAVNFAVCPVGALHGARNTPERVVADSLTYCFFLDNDLAQVFGNLDLCCMELLNATCGWILTRSEWNELKNRITIMERCYCLREGHLPIRDDVLPERFFDEAIFSKSGEKRILDKDVFMEQRQQWYQSIGLNRDGIPSNEYLEKLGLGFTIAAAENARCIES